VTEKNSVELSWFVGKTFTLDAVDMFTEKRADNWCDEDASVIRFRLNGEVFQANEDSNDGYRSCMEELIRLDGVKMNNVFEPATVRAEKGPPGDYENDTVQFFDVETSKLVLEIGTSNTADYYPSFISDFQPQNMESNMRKELEEAKAYKARKAEKEKLEAARKNKEQVARFETDSRWGSF
jgi:hypothetical protein